MNHSSTLGFSPRLPVSVYGTGALYLKLRGFSWKLLRHTIHLPEGSWYYPALASLRIYLQTYTYTVQRTIPSVRGAFITPSSHRNIK